MDKQKLDEKISQLSPYERDKIIYALLNDEDSTANNGDRLRILRRPDGSTLGCFEPTKRSDQNSIFENGSEVPKEWLEVEE